MSEGQLNDQQNSNQNSSSSNMKNIKRNTIFNLIKTISMLLYPLIVFPYVSRILGAENIGKINFASSILSYFSLLATLGVTTYAVRECSRLRQDKEHLGRTVSQIFSINVCTSLLSYLLLVLCLILFPVLKDYSLLIIIQSISILFTMLGTDWLNMAMEDFKYITIRTCVFQVIAVIALIMFVHKPEHYIIYTVISLISSCGANAANIYYRRKFCKVNFTFRMDWKHHFPPIILLFSMMVSQTILNSIDTTMLGLMKGDYVVGLYSMALKIKNIISQVVASIAWVMIPQLSTQFSKKNYEEINKLLHNAVLFTVTLGLPCIVGIYIIAPEIVVIVGGTEYIGAGVTLRIMMISMGISFAGGIFGNMILLPSMREKQFTLACFAGMAANVFFNYLLIPRVGIEGAAIASVISGLVIQVLVSRRIEKEICFGNMKAIFTAPVIGCLGMVILGLIVKYFIKNPFMKVGLVVTIGVFLYVGMLIWMKNEVAERMIVPIIRKIRGINGRK